MVWPLTPYMVFAFGRHLARLPSHVLGMELRHACEAVQVVGCLPASLGPFDRRKERPPRSRYVSWEKWSEYADVDNIVRVAFFRRRQGVYLIDGPHGNMFDNTRAALGFSKATTCGISCHEVLSRVACVSRRCGEERVTIKARFSDNIQGCWSDEH
ncbi:hypothetical protein C3747_138g48 [Trypanosoma cruzi]|uniref:Uncharacterized protein n=1 Tax=Trypanosoma cruzi TaxID=5693 RepID=A0A2V2W943_TRYCR|nr:hypothetical protein C3747_138g48 [Trypanosoma cruzi]